MNDPDFINGSFELGGALLTCLNIRRLLRDKQVRGISLWPSVFFTCWGGWNLFYYTHLAQPYSFAAGALLTVAKAVWLTLALRWRVA